MNEDIEFYRSIIFSLVAKNCKYQLKDISKGIKDNEVNITFLDGTKGILSLFTLSIIDEQKFSNEEW